MLHLLKISYSVIDHDRLRSSCEEQKSQVEVFCSIVMFRE